MEKIIKHLEDSIKSAEKHGEDMNAVSWGMQEGILISYNDAILIVKALKGYKEPVKRACPRCHGTNVMMFTADLDICWDCKNQF